MIGGLVVCAAGGALYFTGDRQGEKFFRNLVPKSGTPLEPKPGIEGRWESYDGNHVLKITPEGEFEATLRKDLEHDYSGFMFGLFPMTGTYQRVAGGRFRFVPLKRPEKPEDESVFGLPAGDALFPNPLPPFEGELKGDELLCENYWALIDRIPGQMMRFRRSGALSPNYKVKQSGSDSTAKNICNGGLRCPLRPAIDGGDLPRVRELIAKGHRVPLASVVRLGGAPDKQRLQIMAVLAESGSTVKGKDGEECLWYIAGMIGTQMRPEAEESLIQVFDWLLQQGVNVNAKTGHGKTALHLMAYLKDHPLLEKLVKAGADIEAKDDDGRTPLAVAAIPDVAMSRSVEEFLKLGADPNARSNSGRTVLIEALSNVYCGMNFNGVEALLKYGAKVNLVDSDGATALIHAVNNLSGRSVIELLLKYGADRGIRDKTGKTALDWKLDFFTAPGEDRRAGEKRAEGNEEVELLKHGLPQK